MMDRGKQFFESGDLITARILFLRAANAGDAAAAVAMDQPMIPSFSPTAASSASSPTSPRREAGTKEPRKWARPKARAACRCSQTADSNACAAAVSAALWARPPPYGRNLRS